MFGETDAETGKKVAAAFRAGLTPTICVGETLVQREAGETLSVVKRQLRAAVAGIDAEAVYLRAGIAAGRDPPRQHIGRRARKLRQLYARQFRARFQGADQRAQRAALQPQYSGDTAGRAAEIA